MLKLWPWHEAGAADNGVVRGDPVESRQWLERQLIDDVDVAQARCQVLGLADGTESWRMDDTQLKLQLVAALDDGRLHIGASTPVRLRSLVQAQAPASAPASALAATSSPRPMPPPRPTPPAAATFGPELDTVAMAAVLKRAAQDGVPFCEECERAKADMDS